MRRCQVWLSLLVFVTGCRNIKEEGPVQVPRRVGVLQEFEVVKRCESAYGEGSYESAVSLCRVLVKDVGAKNRMSRLLAFSLEKLKRVREAIAVWSQATLEGAEVGAVSLRIARLYAGLGEYERAVSYFVRDGRGESRRLKTKNELFSLMILARKYREAELMGRAILARDRKNLKAYRNLLFLYYKWGKLDQALLVGLVALQIVDSKDSDLLNNLGLIYLKKRDLERARAYFQKSLRYNREGRQARSNMGMLALERGAWRDAARHFKVLTRLHPDDLKAKRSLGVALMGMGKLSEAKRLYSSVLAGKPDDPEALFQLGIVVYSGPSVESKRRAVSEYFEPFLANPAAKKLQNYRQAVEFIKQATARVKALGGRPVPVRPRQ